MQRHAKNGKIEVTIGDHESINFPVKNKSNSMIKYSKSIFILWMFLHISGLGYADDYPRNYNIDIVHYKFELALSDKTDEMMGTASITVLFRKKNVYELRLDFINKSTERKGRGMVVDSISLDGKSFQYTHSKDELFIRLSEGS
ncbi:MAG: hypothetical protein ABIN89_03640, partial [Chitinophagaceae bacterium]